ncbi:hypothetical protein BBK82_33005 [Lentzea guizhouensis]|uniref:Peptidase C51 domain-containing protein n=1 Tax=Lentzea guizhouensis TaxID=1586287 RepID=A0A1B2HQZ8_9PSEU|nr:hypothetical protein [Lentzea guizhouensis]ANZ40138.1 hypothetical protein BBK82_33005 [Lentzea guizhouensis]
MRFTKMTAAVVGVLGAALISTAAPAGATEQYTGGSAVEVAAPWLEDTASVQAVEGDVSVQQTAAGAIRWMSDRRGSTAYEGYCERAVRLAWNRSTHHASAIAHWRSSDGTRRTTGTPPRGAFVFWNISQYGHVGIADGNGGFWSTSVGGKIGHAGSVGYFSNYLGWKPGNSN